MPRLSSLILSDINFAYAYESTILFYLNFLNTEFKMKFFKNHLNIDQLLKNNLLF